MNDTTWSDSLSPHDPVWIIADTVHAFREATVEGATATEIVVEGTRYSRLTGCELTEDGNSRKWLRRPDEEIRRRVEEEWHRAELLGRIRAISWHQQPTETLRQVVAALDRQDGDAHPVGAGPARH